MNGDPTPLPEDPRAVHNGNDPAYSSPSFVSPNGDIAWGAPGLTKRELFDAMALQGLLSNYPACIQAGFKDARGDFEEFALMRADALLRELSK